MSNITGFASRRLDSCLNTEMRCGETHDSFQVCCPGDASCPHEVLYGNSVCCENGTTCGELPGPNVCADKSALLYTADVNNMTRDGFCCSKDQHAFKLENNYVGCLDSEAGAESGTVWLVAIPSTSATSMPTSNLLHSSAVVKSTSTSTDADTDGSPSHSHAGAIAGGVIGGIAALALLCGFLWFFLRRRNGRNIGYELDSTSRIHEKSSAQLSELPINGRTRIFELSGQHASHR